MAFEVVGRDEELSFVAAFVDEARDEPSALVLEGTRGSGSRRCGRPASNTRACGLPVLVARPAEHALAHAGLGDLLEEWQTGFRFAAAMITLAVLVIYGLASTPVRLPES